MRKTVILGCIALASLAALNLWTWRQLSSQREEASVLREQLARERSAPLARAEPKALIVDKAVPPAHADAIADLPGMGPTFSTKLDALFQDPEFMRAWRTQVRATSEAIYPDVQRALKMSPDMTNRLYDLLVDHVYAMNESMSRAAEGKRDDAADEARVQREQDEIAALLGPARTKAWTDYKENLEYRAEVNRLRVDMGGGPNGLRDEQIEALIPVYRAASELPGVAPSPEDPRERQKAIDAHILEGARSILEPKQLAELERMTRRREELEDASAVLEQRPMQLVEKASAREAPAAPN